MSERILIADDNPRITNILRLSFKLLGYETETAADGEEALSKAYEFKPDLVILDVMMPRQTGFQVCKSLKEDPAMSDIPVVLLSAKNREEDISWGRDFGADAYICKPYEPKSLEDLVARLLSDRRHGTKSLAWSGLPQARQIEGEYEARKTKEALVLLEASLESRSLDLFALKYGQPRLGELVRSFSMLLPKVVAAATPGGRVGQDQADNFVLLVPSDRQASLREEVDQAFQYASEVYCDPKDRERGCFLYPDPVTGKVERVPLLRLVWKTLAIGTARSCSVTEAPRAARQAG